MPKSKKIHVDEIYKGKRLDIFLAEQLTHLSRSRIKKLIEEEMVVVNGEPVRAGYKLRSGDLVRLEEPVDRELRLKSENIPLEIKYEDEDVIVVDKPGGMVVHPAVGNWEATLVNALLYHYPDLFVDEGDTRPGIVHRLDKDTSGLLVIARNERARSNLVSQLKERRVERRYWALVHGRINTIKGKIDAPIGRHPVDRKKMAVVEKNSKQAVTNYTVLEQNDKFSLLELKLETGRTHQIRVHMAYINHPVVGDAYYGSRKNPFNLERQFLHAYLLGFEHPTRGEHVELSSPLPGELKSILDKAGLELPPPLFK